MSKTYSSIRSSSVPRTEATGNSLNWEHIAIELYLKLAPAVRVVRFNYIRDKEFAVWLVMFRHYNIKQHLQGRSF